MAGQGGSSGQDCKGGQGGAESILIVEDDEELPMAGWTG
jgi:hypothetical protein